MILVVIVLRIVVMSGASISSFWNYVKQYRQMYCTYRKTVRNLLAYSLLADNSSFKRALC